MSQGPPSNSSQTGLPIASQPFPGSLTPGWNDPPSIQYNPQTTGTPGRTKLNKRVPFPLQQVPTTTKPTAIVQPCQTTALGATGGIPCSSSGSSSGNIAVVHPMQYPNQFTNPTAAYSINYTTSTPPPPPAPQPQPSTSASASGDVPTMSVPAVPRQNNENITGAVFSSSPTIQHI